MMYRRAPLVRQGLGWRKLGGSLKEAWKKLEEDGDGKRSTRSVESGFVLYIRMRR